MGSGRGSKLPFCRVKIKRDLAGRPSLWDVRFLLAMLTFPAPSPSRGRYAPSPTGLIHVGNARTALAAWLSVRSAGWPIRMAARGPRRAARRAGPGRGGAGGPRLARARLGRGAGRRRPPTPPTGSRSGAPTTRRPSPSSSRPDVSSPAARSRKDLRELASAPHSHDGRPPYPARLRPRRLDADLVRAAPGAALPGRRHPLPGRRTSGRLRRPHLRPHHRARRTPPSATSCSSAATGSTPTSSPWSWTTC